MCRNLGEKRARRANAAEGSVSVCRRHMLWLAETSDYHGASTTKHRAHVVARFLPCLPSTTSSSCSATMDRSPWSCALRRRASVTNGWRPSSRPGTHLHAAPAKQCVWGLSAKRQTLGWQNGLVKVKALRKPLSKASKSKTAHRR